MSEKRKTAEIEALILRLLNEESEVSIRSVAKALGVSKDDDTERKAIRRALLSLEERNQIIPRGAGRSRVYVLSGSSPSTGQSPALGQFDMVKFFWTRVSR